ncbi:MAG: hypothetical protein M3Z26_15375 [Bacteroidota bacterium]|nr:hypothetical protein [Bacteroidota bacterium]
MLNFDSKFAVDLTTLEKNVKDHPASSFARFLLLSHYKKTNDTQFENLARQSALHFNNLHWMQFQLLQTDLKVKVSGDIDYPEETGDIQSTIVENLNPIKENNKEFSEEYQHQEFSGDSTELSIDHHQEEPNGANLAFVPKEEILEADQENNKSSFENTFGSDAAFEEKEEMQQNINSTESQTSVIASQTLNDSELLVFEPLHTVDYFASQGIKIKEDALMNDKLGKQMKSFTAWLKSMKKLHPGKLPEQNEVIEKIIQSSAEESNADAEVLTEAMAEVLIKQNKVEKAREMYQKLSLLNPSKNAYFAAKIESLKPD